jgi:hypothetical protein
MKKVLFLITLSIILFASCLRKKSPIGKWQMVGNGQVVNFLTDSSGYIVHADTIHLPKITKFIYHTNGDTLFEDTPAHLFGKRKWLILKLTEDTLFISCDKIKALYYKIR